MISSLESLLDKPREKLGGKAVWLAWLYRAGVVLPPTICLTTDAYFSFLDHNRLREKLAMELHRKKFSDMRWEEIWDVSQRIRNLFLQAPMPPQLEDLLLQRLEAELAGGALVVRSSAQAEDQAGASFAGLHDSFVNLRGVQSTLLAIRKVWASLWSDKALLYRKELSLSAEDSGMAVVIQQLVPGQVSGICFTREPVEEKLMAVEAVHGLNQGLVDGRIAPDRWLLAPDDGQVRKHIPPQEQRRQMVAGREGVNEAPLAEELADTPPLSTEQLLHLAATMRHLHDLAGSPLDVEWTIADEVLHILQARPVTARKKDRDGDRRAWYLSLHRSYANLLQLRSVIEDELLPAMTREADAASRVVLTDLPDDELAREIRHRQERSGYWTQRYWDDCIPFAHGVRLFGEIYNEVMIPEDPHEFIQLLQGQSMLSVQRNATLGLLAKMVAGDPQLRDQLADTPALPPQHNEFNAAFDRLISDYGSYFAAAAEQTTTVREMFVTIILEYAEKPETAGLRQTTARQDLKNTFFQRLTATRPDLDGPGLLDLARASYRLRDDDNIFLGRIEEQAANALSEGKRRLHGRHTVLPPTLSADETAAMLEGAPPPEISQNHPRQADTTPPPKPRHSARQLIGQPAATGVARGRARVITSPRDAAAFKNNEILVVASIQPNMTFFAPLAAAIVEQRGGMLIHGAIIAREYGIPCVTGVADATRYIATGDLLTVDGYLGIVTVDKTG